MKQNLANHIVSTLSGLVRTNTGLLVWAFFLGAYVSMGLSANKPVTTSVMALPGGPGSLPPMSEESIRLAMEYFQIELPANTAMPTLDIKLKSRGLTSRSLLNTLNKVSIGPEAFMSWGLLASTIAHEVDIHCKQNLLWITLQEMVGINGSVKAEIEAYNYELSNSKKFGLRAFEVHNIRRSRDYYYPAI